MSIAKTFIHLRNVDKKAILGTYRGHAIARYSYSHYFDFSLSESTIYRPLTIPNGVGPMVE